MSRAHTSVVWYVSFGLEGGTAAAGAAAAAAAAAAATAAAEADAKVLAKARGDHNREARKRY